MRSVHAADLQKGNVVDYTPWCEEGVTATVVVEKVSDIGPGRVSVTASMLAVNGATEDEYGLSWSASSLWMPLDADQEMLVL